MSLVLAYTSESTRTVPAMTDRDHVAKILAGTRKANALAAKDPMYGMDVCTCVCRRCIPTKSDCGGCIAGGCRVEFLSYADAQRYFASFGITFDAKTRRFVD